MRKFWIVSLFLFVTGGLFAQMPVILESELKRLQAEAANKAGSERSFRNRSVKAADDEEYVSAEEQKAPATTNTSETTKSITKTGVRTTTKTTSVKASNEEGSAQSSNNVQRFRERQKRIKGGK